MDWVKIATTVGILYREAEEEAAELRRNLRVRRARMRRRRLERRLAISAFVSGNDQSPSKRYAQVNDCVPILFRFFSEADLKPAFRLSRDTINVLVRMLPRQKPHGWSHEIEIAVGLYWLACGTLYRVTADIFGIPRATVGRIVHSVVEEMMAILHNIIHFPKPDEMEEVGAGFARMAGHEAFRYVAGAIDGCHIRILPPAEPQKRCYINRKLFPSVIHQGVCDSRGKFLDTYVGNTGSVHDALVLRRSPMYKESLYPPAGFFLLGDGGYPCLQRPVTIITPYRQPVAGQV
ncbi:putative nuclease HARBI1 [Sander lucioperca]|uniref:putative nuclease HARBI1 n=1 Tax=Sander lucioperca TaxID=283035 RepID=UPI001653B22E|nr:putative nuclease HARBI1 [Sander lucioperca]